MGLHGHRLRRTNFECAQPVRIAGDVNHSIYQRLRPPVRHTDPHTARPYGSYPDRGGGADSKQSSHEQPSPHCVLCRQLCNYPTDLPAHSRHCTTRQGPRHRRPMPFHFKNARKPTVGGDKGATVPNSTRANVGWYWTVLRVNAHMWRSDSQPLLTVGWVGGASRRRVQGIVVLQH